jgi:hypothetical protein
LISGLDVVFSGPPGQQTQLSLNVAFNGSFTFPPFDPTTYGPPPFFEEEQGFISVDVSAPNAGGNLFGTLDFKVTPPTGPNQQFVQNLSSGVLSGPLAKQSFTLNGQGFVTNGTTMSIDMEVIASVSCLGNCKASVNFSDPLGFPQSGPVFNLPAGWTANSTDGTIVNNVFVAPEPSTWALVAVPLIGLAAIRRRGVRAGSRLDSILLEPYPDSWHEERGEGDPQGMRVLLSPFLKAMRSLRYPLVSGSRLRLIATRLSLSVCATLLLVPAAGATTYQAQANTSANGSGCGTPIQTDTGPVFAACTTATSPFNLGVTGSGTGSTLADSSAYATAGFSLQAAGISPANATTFGAGSFATASFSDDVITISGPPGSLFPGGNINFELVGAISPTSTTQSQVQIQVTRDFVGTFTGIISRIPCVNPSIPACFTASDNNTGLFKSFGANPLTGKIVADASVGVGSSFTNTVTVHIDLSLKASASGPSSDVSFLDGFGYTTSGPVVTGLPTGWTANSASGSIVNNMAVVPEPSTGALVAVSLFGLAAARCRRD